MEKQSFLRRCVVHLGYWAVIAFLGIELMKLNRYSTLNESLSESFEQSLTVIGDCNKAMLDKINKNVDAYPKPTNEMYRVKSNLADSATTACQQRVRAFANNITDSAALHDAVENEMKQLSAILCQIAMKDSLLRSAVERCLNVSLSKNQCDKSITVSQAVLAMELAKTQLINRYSAATGAVIFRDYFSPELVFMPVNLPKVGQPFCAKFMVAEPAYFDFEKELTEIEYYLNGKKLPESHNLGELNMIFDKPGTHQLALTVKIKSLNTGQVQEFSQDFEVEAY